MILGKREMIISYSSRIGLLEKGDKIVDPILTRQLHITPTDEQESSCTINL